jgi:hypothetical protein
MNLAPLSITPNFPDLVAFRAQVRREQDLVANTPYNHFIGALWQRALLSPYMTAPILRAILGHVAGQVEPGQYELDRLREIVYNNRADYFYCKYTTWLVDLLAVSDRTEGHVLREYSRALLKDVREDALWKSSRFVFELSALLEMHLIKQVLDVRKPEVAAFVETEHIEPSQQVLGILESLVYSCNVVHPDPMMAFLLLTEYVKTFSRTDRRALAQLLVGKLISKEIVFGHDLISRVLKAMEKYRTPMVLVARQRV